ncbi:MAG: hypothetical protein ACTSXH_00640 [Promethearchaeota archaeon]
MRKLQLILLSSVILLSSSWLFINTKASTQMDPPPPDTASPLPYWGFDVNTTIGWKLTVVEGEIGGPRELDLIYNITEIKLIENGIQFGEDKANAYGIVLDRLFWNANASTPGLEPLRNVIDDYPLLNVSLVNYTKSDPLPVMFPFDPEAPEEGSLLLANPFIPINGTDDKPDLNYSAELLYPFYNFSLCMGKAPTNTSTTTDTDHITYWRIDYDNSDNGTYAHLIYDINGTLTTGEVSIITSDSEKVTINYTRITDFNPVNEIEWAYDVGDIFYEGQATAELRIEIVDINETTIIQENESLTYQELWANITAWDGGEQKWVQVDYIPIGRANDYDPMIIIEGPSFFLLPINTTGYDVEQHWKQYADDSPYVDTVETGSNWIRIYSSNNDSYVYMEYYGNGVLKYFHKYSVADFAGPGDTVMFYKNSTVISGPDNEFVIYPFGAENDFQIKISINVSQATHVLFAAFHYLPIENELENALVYLDIWMNDSSYLTELNITILCTDDYDDGLKLQKLNYSGSSPVWIDIDYDSTVNRANTTETSATFYNTIYGLSEIKIEEEILINWEIVFSRAFARAFEQAFARAFEQAFARALKRALEQQ